MRWSSEPLPGRSSGEPADDDGRPNRPAGTGPRGTGQSAPASACANCAAYSRA
jgi:hypothetical protein